MADAREQLYQAAVSCDFQAISELAAGPRGPVMGYGGQSACGGNSVGFWENLVYQRGGDPMRLIAGTLELPYAVVEVGSSSWPGEREFFLWPAVVASEAPTEAQWDELRTLYSYQEIRGFRSDPSGRYEVFVVCLPAASD
ncbi:MAG: hypothetical protein ABIJ48_08620 [Actinomycetota bacterium]